VKQHFLAPWAEPVPDAPYPFTTDDLLRLPKDVWRYELVEGRLVRMTPSGGEAAVISANLVYELLAFVKPRGLGRVTDSSGAFRLSSPGQPDVTLAPDVAFVETSRVPAQDSPDRKRAWPVAPNLVAEVASPYQFKPGMAEKAQRYLECGVTLVWIFWPERLEVDVWRPGAHVPVTTLTIRDMLDGLDALPGFTCRLVDIFM